MSAGFDVDGVRFPGMTINGIRRGRERMQEHCGTEATTSDDEDGDMPIERWENEGGRVLA